MNYPPDYVGSALRDLTNRVSSIPSRRANNRYLTAMGNLENAKFEFQKPMMELQQAQTREKMRPVNIKHFTRGMPQWQGNLTFANNKLGIPPIAEQYASAFGAKIDQTGKLVREDGSPVMEWELELPKNRRRISRIKYGNMHPLKMVSHSIAGLEDKLKTVGLTPAEKTTLEKLRNLTPEQKLEGMIRHRLNVGESIAGAVADGDVEWAEGLRVGLLPYLDDEIAAMRRSIEGEERFEQEKELADYRAGKESKPIVTWQNPSDPNDIVNLPQGTMPPDGYVKYAPKKVGELSTEEKAVKYYAATMRIPEEEALELYRNDKIMGDRMRAASKVIDANQVRFFGMQPDEINKAVQKIYRDFGVDIGQDENEGTEIPGTVPKKLEGETPQEYINRVRSGLQ